MRRVWRQPGRAPPKRSRNAPVLISSYEILPSQTIILDLPTQYFGQVYVSDY